MFIFIDILILSSYILVMKESIKALREKNNYSQATVAKYLNVSRQMYIKYESGEAEPPVKVVVALCNLYKVDYAQIIDNKISSREFHSLENDSSSEMNVESPAAAYGSSSYFEKNSNFELAKTIIPRLSVFEQLQMLTVLVNAIQKNGTNELVASTFNKENSRLKNLSKAEIDEQFMKFSGFLKNSKVMSPKESRLEHIYEKYGR